VNEVPSAHPLVAPDESFLIFDSEASLLLSLHTESQGWSRPVPIEEINETGNIMTAALSPDGEYLFFYANHDIYWVSTRVLDPYMQ
jgi:hypothetical protein